MTATNHALTGALLGFTIANPVLAIIVSFMSHFLLDVIPHYGSNLPPNEYVRSRQFKTLLVIDIVLCFCLVVVLAVHQSPHWRLAASCAFVATLPDAVYARNFLAGLRDTQSRQRVGAIQKFSMAIQWYERPPGAIVEIAWASAAIVLLTNYL